MNAEPNSDAIQPWDQFHRAAHISSCVAEVFARAEGYAWGWQDAGGPAQLDDFQAADFARAYALGMAEVLTGGRTTHPTVSQAWKAWLAEQAPATDLTGHLT
ncbi:hypothetical protein [Nocardia panacis]|nr:hypothetical protein [Nocardia panacis]